MVHVSPDAPLSLPEALGQSEAFLDFQEQISRVAPIDRPVLILGERGTGKELAAARIHYLSKRWQKPFVTLNCAALTPGLIGSELFGHEKGAFTGARDRHQGRFEMAGEGTLFLDEMGNIPMEVQEKILRVVEYGVFERVGASRPIQVDVRMVAATNADLPAMARAGTFKSDLLDRLSFEVIYVPPLRHREGDIPLLAEHFAGRMAFELGWDTPPVLTDRALADLAHYPWPGNVRELKNVIERAVYKCPGDELDEIIFDPFDSPWSPGLVRPKGEGSDGSRKPEPAPVLEGEDQGQLPEWIAELVRLPLKQAVQQLEHRRMVHALETSRFNQRRAARQLGLTYDQFRGIKKRLGI